MEYPESYYDLPEYLQRAFRKRVDLALVENPRWSELNSQLEGATDPDEEDRIDAIMTELRADAIEFEWTLACREGLFLDEDEETQNMTKGNADAR